MILSYKQEPLNGAFLFSGIIIAQKNALQIEHKVSTILYKVFFYYQFVKESLIKCLIFSDFILDQSKSCCTIF